MKIYLAGPMRGIPNFNFPAFHYAAAKLRQEGHTVFSPAEKGEETELTNNPEAQESLEFRRKVFRLDTDYICREADTVALLKGWEKSSGARAEKALADAIGLQVWELGLHYNLWQEGRYDNDRKQEFADMGDAIDLSDDAVNALAERWQAVQMPTTLASALLPADAKARKGLPITTGVIDYFPRALAYIASISVAGNNQHNPGKPLHWDRTKSTDHVDCIARHLVERGTKDTDGLWHDGKLGWRALANLETFLEGLEKKGISPYA